MKEQFFSRKLSSFRDGSKAAVKKKIKLNDNLIKDNLHLAWKSRRQQPRKTSTEQLNIDN